MRPAGISEAGRFNTQPPEGGWPAKPFFYQHFVKVSTHSRPKAAGAAVWGMKLLWQVSTHSRPKAAGKGFEQFKHWLTVSTHSRPKAAG